MEKKNLVLVVLCVAIGIMAVAFAAFSTTLNVEGTVSMDGEFAVTFSEATVQCVANAVDASQNVRGTFTRTETIKGTLSVNLYTPGDVVTCTIPVANTGTLAAKEAQEVSIVNTKASDIIEATVVNSPDTLLVGETANIVVTVKYKDTDIQPDEDDLTANFTIEAVYTQDVQ